MEKKQVGYFGEDKVREYLISKGYEIIKSNYCMRGGEIDIIAKNDDTIAFVEVKTRAKNSLTSGFEAITRAKQKFIAKTAVKFMATENYDLQPRFDAAEVILDGDKVLSIDYIEGAFDTTGMNIY